MDRGNEMSLAVIDVTPGGEVVGSHSNGKLNFYNGVLICDTFSAALISSLFH